MLTMSYLIEPYSASELSLIFFGAPHDMDDTMCCNICRPIKTYRGSGIIKLCPEMKRFCSDSTKCKFIMDYHNGQVPKFIHKVPVNCKSWSFIISSNNDDVPDISPIFHTDSRFDDILEQTVIGLEQALVERVRLEYELKENRRKTEVLKNAQDHILYGVPIKDIK